MGSSSVLITFVLTASVDKQIFAFTMPCCFSFLPCFPKKGEQPLKTVAPPISELVPAAPPKNVKPDSAPENNNGTMVLVPGDDASGAKAEPQDDAFLRSIFERCDLNGDGHISKIELIKLLKRDREVADFFGLPYHIRQEDGTRDQMEAWFQRIDKDGDRFLTFDEFKHWFEFVKAAEPGNEECQTTNVQPPVQRDASRLAVLSKAFAVYDVFDPYDAYLRQVFNKIDADCDGYITTTELTGNHERMDMFASSVLTDGLSVEGYVQLLDRDGDGRITFDEFSNCFKPKLQSASPDM